jgi:putative transcriptional regulator
MAKKRKMFDELQGALTDALKYEQGDRVDLCVVEIPPKPREMKPKQIREIRLGLNATQVTFAHFLNVHPNTVRSWEQGNRKPRAGDLKLLAIAKSNPRALLAG